MNRCLVTATAMLALAAPVLASAQVQRNFPANALRGELTVGMPPQVTLNGKTAYLAPGARIRDKNQMIIMSGAISGTKLVVNYTTEQYGYIKDVWILRSDEIAKLWPRTAAEAASWTFDPIGQTWTK